MQDSTAASSSRAWHLKRPSQKRPVQPSSRLARRAMGSAVRVAEDRVAASEAAFRIGLAVRTGREQADPAFGHLGIRPTGSCAWIDMDHCVDVVAHHGVGVEADAEDLRELDQAGLDPGLAVVEGSTAERVKATEEGAADAAGDAVVVARSSGIDELVARCGHGGSVA